MKLSRIFDTELRWNDENYKTTNIASTGIRNNNATTTVERNKQFKQRQNAEDNGIF